MRSSFKTRAAIDALRASVSAGADAGADDREDDALGLVFEIGDESFTERLKGEARIAHFHLFAAAFRRSLGGAGFGPEPECIKEMVTKLMADADPLLTLILEFLDERIDWDPPRPADMHGHEHYAWITEKELRETMIEDARFARRAADAGLKRALANTGRAKELLATAMLMRGRPKAKLQLGSANGPRQKPIAFSRVAWRPLFRDQEELV